MIPRGTSAYFLVVIAGFLLTGTARSQSGPVTFAGNGNTGFGGAIGHGSLTLANDGTNLFGILTTGATMDNALVLYLQTAPGGYASTAGFGDAGDALRSAISGYTATGNGGASAQSALTFAAGFRPNYAIALQPGNGVNYGGLWALANGGNNSLPFVASVNLSPTGTDGQGDYAFSFGITNLGLVPGLATNILLFGTFISDNGYRSTEALAGNDTGVQGWNPFTQSGFANYPVAGGSGTAVSVGVDPTQIWYAYLNYDSNNYVYIGGNTYTLAQEPAAFIPSQNAGARRLILGINTDTYAPGTVWDDPAGNPLRILEPDCYVDAGAAYGDKLLNFQGLVESNSLPAATWTAYAFIKEFGSNYYGSDLLPLGASGAFSVSRNIGAGHTSQYGFYVFGPNTAPGSSNSQPTISILTTGALSAPDVTITSPTNGAVFDIPASIAIAGSVSDTGGTIVQVQFDAGDGSPITAVGVTNGSFNFVHSYATPGAYMLTATATDNLGTIATSSVNITVMSTPKVSITDPPDGSVLAASAAIAINATASDNIGMITRVAFFAGTIQLGVVTNSPFNFNWTNATAGTNILTAVALDNYGASATSAPVSIRVLPPPPPPTSSDAAYTFITLAGTPGTGSSDGVGTDARFYQPGGVTVDTSGNIYVADTGNNTIREITPSGVVSTIAGVAGTPGSEDGTNSAARFSGPAGMTIDNAGNLYVADSGNNTIRKITAVGTNWVTSTLAGLAGIRGSADGMGTNSQFFAPASVAVDGATNVYVADSGNSTIRKITAVGANWMVTTLAGSAPAGGLIQAIYSGSSTNDGVGTNAQFYHPDGVAVDEAGNVYVADSGNYTIRKITPDGMVRTIAGSAGSQGTADGTNGSAEFLSPYALTVVERTNIYVVDTFTPLFVVGSYGSILRQITTDGTNWVVTTFAGTTGTLGGNDGTGTNALFAGASGIAWDGHSVFYVTDDNNDNIRKITSAGVVTTFAGPLPESVSSSDGNGDSARFLAPVGIAVDNAGTIYVTDSGNDVIREITPAGVVSTLAGSAGATGSTDGVGNIARFASPNGAAADEAGNIYVVDSVNDTIREITPSGVVSTIAGMAGTFGTNDGVGSAARFGRMSLKRGFRPSGPMGLAVDKATNLYVADTYNDNIRRITPSGTNWTVSTIAGLAGVSGSADGAGTSALFYQPFGIAVDDQTNVYVADTYNSTIRKLTLVGTNWVVTTIAGQPGITIVSQDGVGTNAFFEYTASIAADHAGNLYVGEGRTKLFFEQLPTTIRKLTPTGTDWEVGTIGGLAGTFGSADGIGSAARFNSAEGIAVDAAGNVYVTDTGNSTIRKGFFSAYTPANPVPYTRPQMNGTLTVTLNLTNGQWRFPWELGWRYSGTTASNLAANDYTIEFRNVPGYLPIPPFLSPVTVADNHPTVLATNVYFPTLMPTSGSGANGSLTVDFGPTPPSGAYWGFLGNDPSTFSFGPGFSTNLLPGTYLIGFKPVNGYAKPPNLSVAVAAGPPTVVYESYRLAAGKSGGVVYYPEAVQANTINDLTDYPFGFNGQLQSDAGYGSGVAVQTNVVLTAAHLVFNDQTESYVNEVFWYFQEEAGVFTPQPQQAQGWYILSGYASQRTNDLHGLGGQIYAPDQSSAESRNLDVAAVYFHDPVAGGGCAGYLPSDQVPNQWLTGNTEKMLVGYPVDGSLFGDAGITNGIMYQVGPQPYQLTQSADQVNEAQQVYLSAQLLSYPGNSGGPLLVQLNGYYYPAGVYLGTLYDGANYLSAIRAIDSNVVNLITLAQTNRDNGTNNTGGGVITIVPHLSANALAFIQVQLSPPAAVEAGAGWRLQGDPSFSSDPLYSRTISGTNAVEFKMIPGWMRPTNQTVTIFDYQIVTNQAFYTVSNPVVAVNPLTGALGLIGTTNTTYQIQSRTSLVSGAWTPLRTNTITTNGFNPVLPPPSPGHPATFYRAQWLP